MQATESQWLRRQARTRPDRPALLDDRNVLSYAALHGEAKAVAAAIAELGATPGSPVAVELEWGLDHAVALHGALLAGVVAQSVHPRLPAPERERALAGGPPALTIDRRLFDAALAAAPAPELGIDPPMDSPCSRVLTSGSSGPPKAVELTRANHHASATASALRLGVGPDELWLCCLPLNHVGGLSILFRSVIYGTAALLQPGFAVERVAAALERGVTTVSLVPTQLRRLLDAGAPVDRPRTILLGGAPVPAELIAETLERGGRPVPTYGLTEACSQVCTLSADELGGRLGSAGRPLPGTSVRIAEGEILVRGPTVAPGALGEDGWLHTGDLGHLDDEGYLWVDGRRDELIVTGGENVRPEEVEEALLSHPAVREAGVVGVPDREWGSAVCAVVVPEDRAAVELEQLRSHCRGLLAPFKLPKRLELRDALPRTGSGKLSRRRLREQLGGRPPGE